MWGHWNWNGVLELSHGISICKGEYAARRSEETERERLR